MAEHEFPGFLRTVEGGYITHKDFLTFIAGASTAQGNMEARAKAWLRKQGVTGPIEALSPQEVTRLTEAAKKVILARVGRERRAIPRVEEVAPTPPDESEPPPEDSANLLVSERGRFAVVHSPRQVIRARCSRDCSPCGSRAKCEAFPPMPAA